jgi:glucans biosynthesis protein
MSGSLVIRRFAPLALALLAACESGPEGVSTVPMDSMAAKPATPESLAAFVEDRARTLAEQPYVAPAVTTLPELAALDYDAYRSIRFRPEAALWSEEGLFRIQLFHPGFLFDEPVRIHIVDDEVRDLLFDPGMFMYEGPAAALADRLTDAVESSTPSAPSLGWSGFRVHFPLNDPDRMDEVVVFQGASYFRLVGPGQVYGLSSRGLAIDVASDRDEEFPDFREFWLVRPEHGARRLVFHALLDAPSVTGAYRFELEPGSDTRLHVDARLFARTDVGKLGVAPLSTMFLFDGTRVSTFDDFRTGVHDSDGLLMHTRRGEWIWRPLSNGRGLRVTSLRDVDPAGFGLAQRARDFRDYLDLEAQYHERPSEWVEVREDERWGGGGVELLEIPTPSEFNDNIAAYWVPDAPMRAGEHRRYRYTLSTFGARLQAQTLAQVERTRVGRDALPGATDPPPGGRRRFVVDYEGGPLLGLAPDAPVRATVETLSGTISDVRARALPDAGGWRATFALEPDGDRPADMRLWIELEGSDGTRTRLSETWTYVWYPEPPR